VLVPLFLARGFSYAGLRDPRFVVDANLGRLARYLRLLGFDATYRNDFDDAEVARIGSRERRIVLTRDRALLKQKIITQGYFVRAVRPHEHMREVLARLDLYRSLRPFTRCLRCNGGLEVADKETVLDQLEPKTRQYYERFGAARPADRRTGGAATSSAGKSCASISRARDEARGAAPPKATTIRAPTIHAPKRERT
jgi:uncharacterized protein with PIN domain